MLPRHEAEIGGKLPAALEQAGVRDAGRETGSDNRTNAGGLARLLDRKAGSERRNHGRHSRRSGFGDTDMAAIVNKKAAPKLAELVLGDVVKGINGSIVSTRAIG